MSDIFELGQPRLNRMSFFPAPCVMRSGEFGVIADQATTCTRHPSHFRKHVASLELYGWLGQTTSMPTRNEDPQAAHRPAVHQASPNSP